MNSLYFGKHLKISHIKIPIQILANNTGPMIPKVHPIRVNHRHNKKIKILKNAYIIQHIINKTLQCEIRYSLSWMSSC